VTRRYGKHSFRKTEIGIEEAGAGIHLKFHRKEWAEVPTTARISLSGGATGLNLSVSHEGWLQIPESCQDCRSVESSRELGPSPAATRIDARSLDSLVRFRVNRPFFQNWITNGIKSAAGLNRYGLRPFAQSLLIRIRNSLGSGWRACSRKPEAVSVGWLWCSGWPENMAWPMGLAPDRLRDATGSFDDSGFRRDRRLLRQKVADGWLRF